MAGAFKLLLSHVQFKRPRHTICIWRDVSAFKIDVTAGLRRKQDPRYRNVNSVWFVCEMC